MARTVDAAKAREWRERLTRWRRSELSVAEFCRRERVSEPSFYWWRQRLAAETSQKTTPRFVELPAMSWPATGMHVTLPSGAVVTLSGQASVDMIAAVVRAAMHAPGEGERC